MTLALALYQPDIPQNTGTLLRLCACLNLSVHIIEPAGFRLDEKALRRSGMDYLDHVDLHRHASWSDFTRWADHNQHRLILATTQSRHSFADFTFQPRDILLLGRESSGVPDHVHEAVPNRLTIPMHKAVRSLNVAIAGAMMISEACRQLDCWPE
jgi:tRNA (cytidine/uridine-2'-O-)-methyltransferase